jgi:HEAT repeat protein
MKMDIEQYRKQCLSEIEGEKAKGPAQHAALGPKNFENSVRRALATLGDADAAPESRQGALGFLGAATFNPPAFAPFNAEYMGVLRKLATDADKGLRTSALERLARSSDRYAHKLLREGLEKTRKPLVSTAKAVQLLGLDDHGAAKPILRQMAGTTTGKVREEVFRALSADTKSAAMFESVTADKSEHPNFRQIAALSLKHASPSRFAKLAKQIVLDDDDDDRLRATAMSAIAHTSEVFKKASDPKFAKAVESVRTSTKSRALKASIGRFTQMLS